MQHVVHVQKLRFSHKSHPKPVVVLLSCIFFINYNKIVKNNKEIDCLIS